MKKYILRISLLFTLILSSCIMEHDNEPICEGYNGIVNENCARVTATSKASSSSELITVNFNYGGNNLSISVEDTDSLVEETLYLQGTRIFNLGGDGVYNNPSIKIGFTEIDRENKKISGSFSFTSDSYTDSSFGTREVEGIEGTFDEVIYTITN